MKATKPLAGTVAFSLFPHGKKPAVFSCGLSNIYLIILSRVSGSGVGRRHIVADNKIDICELRSLAHPSNPPVKSAPYKLRRCFSRPPNAHQCPMRLHNDPPTFGGESKQQRVQAAPGYLGRYLYGERGDDRSAVLCPVSVIGL